MVTLNGVAPTAIAIFFFVNLARASHMPASVFSAYNMQFQNATMQEFRPMLRLFQLDISLNGCEAEMGSLLDG